MRDKTAGTIVPHMKSIFTSRSQSFAFGVQKHPSDRNDVLPITAPHESRHQNQNPSSNRAPTTKAGYRGIAATENLPTATSTLLQSRHKATHNFGTAASCPSATRKNLDPSHSGRESRNTAILLSHNRNWTAISPKPQGSLADWRTSSYTISARGQ